MDFATSGGSVIPDLATVFSWGDANAAASTANVVVNRHLTHVASMAARLGSAQPNGSDVLHDLAALDSESLSRVLAAPETCRRLYAALRGESQGWYEFCRSVAIEGWREQPPASLAHDEWSALGDFCVLAGDEPRIAVQGLIKDRIVLDFDSPAALRPLVESSFRPKFGTPIAFGDSERRTVEGRFSRALHELAEAFPAEYAFVSQIVRSVIPRLDSMNPTFKGSSNQTEIGRTNLINPHLDGLTTVPIAASLVHEAIHNLLYILEQDGPLVPDHETAFDSRIRSPWSGKQVNLRALVHATFVWHALFFMWSSPRAPMAFDPSDVAYIRKFSARGFVDDEIGRVLAPWSQSIRPDVLHQLVALRQFHLHETAART